MSDENWIAESGVEPRASDGAGQAAPQRRLGRLRRRARSQRLHTQARVAAYAQAAGLIALAILVGVWVNNAF
jgi:hypothetical protein